MSASLILNISRNCRLSILITKRWEYTRCLSYIDYGRACNWVAPEEEELKQSKEFTSLASTTHYSHQYKSQNVFLFANTTQHKQSCSAPRLRDDRGEAHVFPKSSSFPYGIGCTCCVAPTKVSITPSLLPPRDKHIQILYSSHSYLWVNLKIGIHRT